MPSYKLYSFLTVLIVNTFSLTVTAQTKSVPFSDPHIRYEGRVAYKTDAAEISWSGTSVTVYFKGRTLSAILKDADTANYYNVIIDDNRIFKIHTDTVKKTYLPFYPIRYREYY